MVRKFVDKEIIPNIQEWDRQGHFEPVILKKLEY
jgi:glutaryl-CoA dehydrogenase (non-decarboxylating)